MIPKHIETLSNLEQRDIYNFFTYKRTNSWVHIKDKLTRTLIEDKIRMTTNSNHEFKSFKGILVLLFSFIFFVINLIRVRKKVLFLGATTGIFKHQSDTLDSYFPYSEVRLQSAIQLNNCGNLHNLYKHKLYLYSNRIIIDNYLFTPLKKIISKVVIILFRKRSKSFNSDLISETIGIPISHMFLLQHHSDFIAGYHLYRLVFKLLRIKKCYIVSATTKSDQVAALLSLNIEVIEVQHGIIGKLHRGFNFVTPPTSLPIPSQVYVYNSFWKNELLSTSIWNNFQIKITGKIKYNITKDTKFNSTNDFILFTGQAGFFDDIIKLLQNGNDFLKEKNIKLYYKPHPRITQNELDHLKHELSDYDAVEIIENSTHNTETYISNCIAHVSVFSSCHFDAIHFLGKTYVFDIMKDNIMEYYLLSNKANIVKIDSLNQINLDNRIINGKEKYN